MTNPATSPSPADPVARWVGEGGSGQHYAHTDEPEHPVPDAPAAPDPFAPRGSRDAAWSRFNATYGRHFGTQFHASRNDGNEVERRKMERDATAGSRRR